MASRSSNRRPQRQRVSEDDLNLRKRSDGLLIGLRNQRWSWWTHWREIADYILPRRYRWLITPNMQSRGSPINQHILDSTATLAARNLAAGMMSGCTDPTKLWFRCKINEIDSTIKTPVSLWLSEVERKMRRILQESNTYNALAVMYLDLVVFGSAVILVYEDYENVVKCVNPCLGEFYLANDESNNPSTFAREFTYTVAQCVEEFGYDNCSDDVQRAWDEGAAGLTREVVIAHLIEPNTEPARYGVPPEFKYRELYWQWGGSASPQGGSSAVQGFLRKAGYYEDPAIPVRWDLVSNDAYGRGPGMDALPDVKQLQLEVRRKAQAIDKLVNPPMLADVQMKNQPASLLPGGITYVTGLTSTGKPGFAPVYQVAPPVKEIMEDLNEVRDRIQKIFFNDLFRTASQFETRSNITAVEWDMRKSESLVMLGPVLERLQTECFAKLFDRIFAVAARAGIFPPAPPEIQGQNIKVEFVSMLEQAQEAAAASGIERLFQVIGSMAGIDPAVVDNVDIDFGIDKLSEKLNNDPRLIRSPEELMQIRQMREQKAQQAQQAEMVDKYAKAAKVASETQVGGGQNALEAMIG